MPDQTARAEDDAATPFEDAGATAPEPTSAQPDPIAVAVELRDRLLRTLAEMENLRKRTDREVAEAKLRGITNFATDVLGVADNMRRALDAVAPELRSSA